MILDLLARSLFVCTLTSILHINVLTYSMTFRATSVVHTPHQARHCQQFKFGLDSSSVPLVHPLHPHSGDAEFHPQSKLNVSCWIDGTPIMTMWDNLY